MVGIRSPIGLVVGSCTSHPGVLGSIPKREEPGKTGEPCVKSTWFLTGPRTKPTCSGTKDRERRSHPHPAGDRQALPLHPPRRDSRNAHANAHARIRPHRHLQTPTVLWGPWSMPRGPSAASPPTATKGTPPAPTGHGSKASTHAPQAHLTICRTSVPRLPNTSKQVGVSVSCAASQQTCD
jgi:hypothetical protein